MSSIAVHTHMAALLDALVAGDNQGVADAARAAISRAEDASEVIGRVGLVAMHGDSDGHTVLTLAAANALCRWLVALRHALSDDEQGQTTGLELVIPTLLAAAPAVRAGKDAPHDYPKGIFPSELGEQETLARQIEQAIYANDAVRVERLLFGLFGTGADYKTLLVRIYDGIGRCFQENGHAQICAVRGAQALEGLTWGEDMPNYIHWLVPHLPLHAEEPSWTQAVRDFLQEPQHSLASYRTRLAAPQNAQALPLRSLLLSNATAPQVCQGVYDALITNGASARGIGSVIALAASDLLQQIDEEDRALFERVSHGLLCASATRLIYTQVQEVAVLPLLFTTACAINALHQDLAPARLSPKKMRAGSAGGGLIAPSLLHGLGQQIEAQDFSGALASAHRYIQLGHDPHALFAVIGLGAAQADASADQGHTLQIVLAAGDEYLAWPPELASTNIEGFLQIALHAATRATRKASASV